MVTPHLEYRVSVWNPYLMKGIKLTEDVQRRATELVQGMRNWRYDER